MKDAIGKALTSIPDAKVIIELEAQPGQQKRPDISFTSRNGRPQYFDVQIVAISKASAKSTWQLTLREAAEESKRKYKAYGSSFQSLIFSASGFME